MQDKTKKTPNAKKSIPVVVAILMTVLVAIAVYFGYKYYNNYQEKVRKQKAEQAEQKRVEEINNQDAVQNVDQPNGAASALPRSQDAQ